MKKITDSRGAKLVNYACYRLKHRLHLCSRCPGSGLQTAPQKDTGWTVPQSLPHSILHCILCSE